MTRAAPARWLLAAGAGLSVLVAGCSAPLPQISMYSDGRRAVTGPTLWCRADAGGTANCPVQHPDADAVRLGAGFGDRVTVKG